MEYEMKWLNKTIVLILLLLLSAAFVQTSGAEVYSVHTASFKTSDQAQKDQNRLRAQGYDAFVVDAQVPGTGKWHRVYVGKFPSRQKALQLAQDMKKKAQIDQVFIHRLAGMKSQIDVAASDVSGQKKTKSSSVQPAVKKEKAPDPVRPKSIDRGKKEAFKELIMGNRKLMPMPPKLDKVDVTHEEVFQEPDERDIHEPVSDSPIYNKALTELKERKYVQALVTFKEFISRKDTSKEWGQRALRHMADCHYWLGRAGSKHDLLVAAEFYKNTLKSFPDPLPENALTYYRLAKTYEHLKYYPEAIQNYKNLIAKYPGAPFVPEAYFKIGEIYYTDGKYNEAAEALIRYQLKYRGKAYAKKSFYLIAHSFYKAKQSANAEIWFRDSRKQWPDLTEMPKELVLDYGMHKISLRRFDEAAAAFSFYVNLYPDDEKNKEVMMRLADAYRQDGQLSPALAVYSRIIDKYSGTKEAGQSMLAMASLGVEHPGLKVFRFMNSMSHYRNPMDTYDALMLENAAGDIPEEAMLQKAAAWVKKGEGRKAADLYLEFLRLYPESKRSADAARGLKTVSAALIEEYFAKKDYLAVAYIYFKSFGTAGVQADEYSQIHKIAVSLKELGLMDDYGILLNRFLKVARNEAEINAASLDIAEGLMIQGKNDEALTMLNALAAKASVRKGPLMAGVQKNLAEIAFRKKQYESAAVHYAAVVRSGQGFSDSGQIYANYARSLVEKKDKDHALQNYLTAVKFFNEHQQKMHAGITYNEIGDLYLGGDNPATGLEMYGKALEIATDGELKYWSQFLLGKTYLKLNKEEDAQNKFSQIKTIAGADGFWTRVVDFYAADSKWWDKYGEMVKK